MFLLLGLMSVYSWHNFFPTLTAFLFLLGMSAIVWKYAHKGMKHYFPTFGFIDHVVNGLVTKSPLLEGNYSIQQGRLAVFSCTFWNIWHCEKVAKTQGGLVCSLWNYGI
jgi:hypothetical protein